MVSSFRRISPGSSQVANKSTLNLILGVFLKLLGFFVVMYTYTDVSPLKARQAEESLHQRFNISVSFLHEMAKNTSDSSLDPVQDEGRSFAHLKMALKTQMDFLATQYEATSKTLVLTVPAETIFDLDGHEAKSPRFATILTDTIQKEAGKSGYKLEIVARGHDSESLIREVSHFAQRMLAAGYPSQNITIGYNDSDIPTVDLRLTQLATEAVTQ